ncbi:hypothetical protein EYR40_010217 [Pleurotus pulmonarius]|nr:hypothetical protein EYR36_010391 [Pleurotus pulmonarius]KAF4588664.1 hypothetical protein EYR40_010217 [Pleurotus pulmonarius]
MPPRRHALEDYNAYSYDPRGGGANAAALLFGENWRPDPRIVPRPVNGEIGILRYGPPADYQIPNIPAGFVPQMPQLGYLGAFPYNQQIAAHGHHLPNYNLYYPPPAGPPPFQNNEPPRRIAAAGPQREVRPGVYCTFALMSTKTIQKQFAFETDLPFTDFYDRVCANLDLTPMTAALGYHIAGVDGPKKLLMSLGSEDDFSKALEWIIPYISRAHSKEYGIEVVNLAQSAASQPASSKGKKRSRADDVPSDTEDDMAVEAIKKLCNHLQCSGAG